MNPPRIDLPARSYAGTARLLGALVVALLAVAGCSNGTSSGGGGNGIGLPDGTGGGGGGGSDTTTGGDTATGSDGVSADGAGGKSIEAQECVAEGKGECDAASECGSEQYCDPCERKCKTPRKLCEPCQSNAQCEKADLGSACIPYLSGGTFCGLVCLSDAGCPKGYACKGAPGAKELQCVPKVGSCGPVAGACKTDADCPFTTICNPDYGTCLKGCGADEECPGSKVCALFRCVDPCTTDAECKQLSAEAVCDGDRCKIPGGCLGPADCPEKATYCDPGTHKCQPGCKTDFDCKEFGKKCENNACLDKGCKENWECSFGEVCVPETGKCKAAEGPYCGTCDAQDENVTACGGKPNKCFSFQDEDGNKVGDFCGLVCSTAASGPCPQGYNCQDIKDQDGNSQGQFCLRQCWVSPFPDKEEP